MPNSPPVIANPDTVVAAAGTGPIALGIAAPTDPENDTLTITLDTVPAYGTVEYFNGSAWTLVGAGTGLTAQQLASLRYMPPPSGEFGGGSIGYSVFDGAATVHGTTAVTVFTGSAAPPTLFFSAASATGVGPDLYMADAAGNLTSLAFSPPFGSFAGENGGFHEFAGKLYFMAFNSSVGDVMFTLDPDGNVTPLADSQTLGGYFGNTQEDAHFTEFAGSLYFRAYAAGNGDELIRVDATGATHVIDINPGPSVNSSPGAESGFTEFDGGLYFSATTASSSNPELIRLEADDSFTPVTSLSFPATGNDAGIDGGFAVFNNALYFNAFSQTYGFTLFRLDHASAPVEVDPTQLDHTNAFLTNSAFHVFNGSLYFNEFSFAVGSDTLIKIDAGGAITPLTYNSEALANAGSLGGFFDFAGSTYFVASTSTDGAELFKLDDTGTISRVTNTIGDAFDANLVSGFVEFAGSLYFDAYDSTGDSLYQLSGSGPPVAVLSSGTTFAGVNGGFQELGGSLYFSAYTSKGYELVKLDADGTVHEYDINTASPGNSFAFSPATDFAVFAHGGAGKDIVVGGALSETLYGGPSADLLAGRGGNDVLDGGAGVDTAVFSGRRSDYHVNLPGNGFIEITDLRPGSPDGTDRYIRVEQFIFSDGSFGAGQLLGGVTIIGTKGEDFINAHHTAPGQPLPTNFGDTIFGRGGADTIYGLGGNDRIFGGGGSDQIFGGPGNDRLDGGRGPDQIFGGAGNDLLLGGPGDDRLFGGPGRDRLNGGTGHNLLIGGPGADRFFFATLNTLGTVFNFIHGVDKFELARHVFKSIHNVSYVAATGDVLFDADGPGGAAPIKFAELAPHLHITASDFLFV